MSEISPFTAYLSVVVDFSWFTHLSDGLPLVYVLLEVERKIHGHHVLCMSLPCQDVAETYASRLLGAA